ncbi:MAG: hypothetical protein K9L56_15455 [Clostridiales bacterium]|nr:hypothetical protein [Clostridiales bacterium]
MNSKAFELIKKILGTKGLALLWKWVESILQSIGEAIWDATWAVIFDAIARAEEKWDKGDWAKDKKQFVIDESLKFIENHEELGWVRKQAVKMFLSMVIDRIITELNDQIGKDWVKQAKEIEDNLDDYFDFID